MHNRLLYSAFALSLTACIADDEPAVVTTVDIARRNCPDHMCGSNSPVVDNLGLHELNIFGVRSSDGFSLRRVDKDTRVYQIRVVGGEIILYPDGGGPRLDGYQVADANLRLLHVPTGTHYTVRIAEVGKTATWARLDGESKNIYTYQLQWLVPQTLRWEDVCSNPTSEPVHGVDGVHSVVFEGDRISTRRKTDDAVDRDWFNIGCAGHALFKLHMTGHTEGARVLGFQTTLDQRTTMLKMLTGDYCGNGVPFTVAGAPLTWRDANGWMDFGGPAAVEAHWGPTGARCLNRPRLEANPTPLGDEVFPNGILEEIEAECGVLPTCAGAPRAYLVSGNP